MKIVFLIIGLLSVGLGAIGVVLPILPSTPFFLLALYCFARSSKRLHTWFLSTSLYKKHLQTFVNHKSMTMKTKLSILISVTVVMGAGFYFMKAVPVGRILLAIVWVAHMYYFLFRVKTENT
ncbi:MAG: YbaN family protein [Clostridiales Family XIII bacterium]|jgi:uncharacterized membrane protein YbaN (DUF454 family)|nr:YbaN family protein [Clostridiales Family XIII bacterium]